MTGIPGIQWPRRGEIWNVYTPAQPNDPHQPRPALVISEDIRNRMSDDVVVIPIFSTGYVGLTRVAIQEGVGGIHHASILFCEEITTIHKDFLADGPLGPVVSDVILQDAVDALLYALGVA